MSVYDTFNQDYKKANELYDKVQDQLKERENIKACGKSTTQIDYSISKHLDTLKFEARNLDKLAYFYLNEPDKFNISKKEIRKRQKKVEQFVELKDDLEQDICKLIKPSIIRSAQSKALNEPEANPDLEGDSNSEVEFLSNRQILEKAREMVQYQDNKFDVVSGIGRNIKEDALNAGEELGVQNDLLGNLHKNLDVANNRMRVVDNKLKKVLKNTNSCYLWMVIVFEIILLLVVIIVL
ncbi:unnamed protein product [Moneuplotes crassus]|uniref:t-SNARE coiled-coil homology domain-containing protein n=1 Tax=Euplotes crassus TaxID=5936 RepID=A0AAD1XSY2_EUPCR|nr:unnamed protein product [Moneuplotes crassus]